MLIAATLDFLSFFFLSWAPQEPQPQNPGQGAPFFFCPGHPRTHNSRIQDQAPGPQFFFFWAPQDPQPQNPGPGPRTQGPHFFFPGHPRTHNPTIQDQATGPQLVFFFFFLFSLGTPGPTTPESRTRPQGPHFFLPGHPRTHNPRTQDQATGPQDPR